MNFYTEDISNGYNWKGLERTIARMMEHLGWRDINVIGGAGDKGGDVLATRAEGNQVKSWVVQSKAVTGDRYVGPQALNEAINALSFYETNVKRRIHKDRTTASGTIGGQRIYAQAVEWCFFEKSY